MRKLLALFVSMFLAGLCVSCGSRTEDGTLRIALLMKAKTNPFFQAMEDGARRAAEELGVTLIPMGLAVETAVDDQINQIDDVTQQRVHAILITPADSKAVIPALRRAREKGILILNVDNRLDPQTVLAGGLEVAAYVGADNEQGGYLASRHLAEILRRKKPGKTEYRVAMLEGIRGVDNAEARKRGFLKAMKEAAGVNVVDSQTANWDTNQAAGVFADMLRAHPDLDGLFCANDMMALGAISALREGNKIGEVLIVSYDNLESAREAIRKGMLEATLEQHPERMGDTAVRQAVKALRKEPIPAETLVDLELVTSASLGAK